MNFNSQKEMAEYIISEFFHKTEKVKDIKISQLKADIICQNENLYTVTGKLANDLKCNKFIIT